MCEPCLQLSLQAEGVVSPTNMEQPKERQNVFNFFDLSMLEARHVITINI